MPSYPVYLRPEMTAIERANAELVLGYFKLWEDDFAPAETFATSFTPDARLRYVSGIQSPIQRDMNRWHIGAGKVVRLNQTYIDMGMTAAAHVHDLFACGPMVVVHRTDFARIPGMPSGHAD